MKIDISVSSLVTAKQVIRFALLFAVIAIVLSYPVLLGNFLNEKFGASVIIKQLIV
jgi:hypothetical protein